MTTKTRLPRDANNSPIPAVRLPASGGAHTVAIAAASARNTVAFTAGRALVSLYATVPCYVRFGGDDVVATTSDHYFPTGIYYDFAIGGDGVKQYTHVAVLRVSTDGNLYISEKE